MKKVLFVAAAAALFAVSAVAQNGEAAFDRGPIRHALLISIDGMHAVDFLNCSKGMAGVNEGKPYCPNLAALSATGVNYVAANTSKPSDRKSTRLNSSHLGISYAVFCL